jgi:para-nitrobenzyl esterase
VEEKDVKPGCIIEFEFLHILFAQSFVHPLTKQDMQKFNLRFTIVLCLSCFAQFATAQNSGCDGVRYKTEVFTSFEKTTVTYAPSITQTGEAVELLMDVYQPTGDAIAMRPVVILEHGGSFIIGQRSDMRTYCEQLAKQGYVAATIQYRLYPFFILGIPDSLGIMDTAVKAVADMKAAVRYFREDAATVNQFHVDPNHIYVGGYSAGAVAALHMAYMDPNDVLPDFLQTLLTNNNGWVGNSGTASNKTYPSDIKAVVNMSGGLYRSEWVDSTGVPLVSIHGTADGTVPYVDGLAANIAYLQGSSLLHLQATNVGVWNYLETVPGGGHTDIYSAAQFAPQLKSFWTNATSLLESLTCQVATGTEQPITASAPSLKIIPNPASGQFISLDLNHEIKQGTVSIFDANGRAVLQNVRYVDGEAVQLPQHLPAGNYTVQVTDLVKPTLTVSSQFIRL